jgi:hypothetical protein
MKIDPLHFYSSFIPFRLSGEAKCTAVTRTREFARSSAVQPHAFISPPELTYLR